MNRQKGMIFDILRGSIYDGPGVRTTVFFKGCALRCIWCHNPESWSTEPQLFYNQEKCVHCLACISYCPTGAQQASGGRHIVKFELCIACGKCIKACNFNALQITGYQFDANSILEEIKRDKNFYDTSGGGVTLSGGEPLLQKTIVWDLLKKCRENDIHTCVETSGFIQRGILKDILPLVDIFLFDYKCTDSRRHKELTGVPNDLILANLDYLYMQGAEIILRCPMVPGVNDSWEHLKGIAELEAKYPRLKGIEILSYHNMGVSKGNSIGATVKLQDIKTVDQAKKDEWAKTFHELNCQKIKIS
jgi:glycyl-radical enzyme activating protein